MAYDGSWFVAPHYQGPWGFVAVQQVPPVVLAVPGHKVKVKKFTVH